VAEGRGGGRALRTVPSAVAARGSPLRGGVAHERRPEWRRRCPGGQATVGARPATHATVCRARATDPATQAIDRAAKPQPHADTAHQAQAEEPTVVRTEVPAAHVRHSTWAFVAEGVRWRQQTLVWTWPEGPVTETAREEPRIWEEGGPR